MNAIIDPIDDQRGRIDVVAQDCRFVGIKFLTKRLVLQPGKTPFCAVDDLDDDLWRGIVEFALSINRRLSNPFGNLFPLFRIPDPAASGDGFFDRWGFALQCGDQCVFDVVFRHFVGVGRVVHRSHVDDLAVFVQHEEFGCVDRSIILGNFLRVVIQDWESELLFFSSFGQFVESIGGDLVHADSDETDFAVRSSVLFREIVEPFFVVDRRRATEARENQNDRLILFEVAERMTLAIGSGQFFPGRGGIADTEDLIELTRLHRRENHAAHNHRDTCQETHR